LELLFDLAVGGRLRRELVKGCVEQALGVFVATLAAAEEAEVCDHLPLELRVSQRSKEDERLLEVLNRERDAAGGMNERESEVVERQRLGAPVAQLTHDRKRGAVLLDSPFVLAFAPKLRTELVESMRLGAPVDLGRSPLMDLHEAMGSPRNAVRVALQVLSGGELVEARLSSPGDPLDRGGACPRRTFQVLRKSELVEARLSSPGDPRDRGGACSKRTVHPVAALEPEHAGQNASEQNEREGQEQYGAESERGQEPRQQEPDSRECENATTELLAID
jgi:hypothetical protein